MAERRAQRERSGPEGGETKPRVIWWHLVVVAILIGLVVMAGIGLNWSTQPKLGRSLVSCQLGPQIAPDLYRSAPPRCIDPSRQYTATIRTSHGDIALTLLPKEAPVTVNNFVVLASHGFYNGLTFWRADSWVVQGGDPRDNGQGGPGYTLPDEASKADWSPGSVGMARFPNGPVNGSQFFIVRGQWPGDGPGNLAFNHFADVDDASQSVLSQINKDDPIQSITVTVKCSVASPARQGPSPSPSDC